MRQRLQKFLPIILIALAAQILAPIAACWAAAAATSDAFGFAEICHSSSPTTDDQGKDHGMDCSACLICCMAAQASVSFDTPPDIAFATPHRQTTQVVWRHRTQDIVACRAYSTPQARAPPSISI
jgi:hypothetical protein